MVSIGGTGQAQPEGGSCPNCGAAVVDHPQNGCALAALIGVVRERGDTPEDEIRKLHAGCDSDALWNDLGRVVDALQDGRYNR